MRIGIDASNLRDGGGVTHLAELLRAAGPEHDGFEQVTVWSGRQTLAQLPVRPWLRLVSPEPLEGGLALRSWWQAARLSAEARRDCSVLFVPGGVYAGSFRPFVTMCRNMLLFDTRERRRYALSALRAKLEALRLLQRRTFRRADGLIFLSDHARQVVAREIGTPDARTAIVPHGVGETWFTPPRSQQSLRHYSPARPFHLLYVSKVDVYKHQWNVVRAVGALNDAGIPVALTLVGGAYPPAARKLQRALASTPGAESFVKVTGAVRHAALRDIYVRSDAFVFASTCENLPNILLEAMAAGLPIACSDRQPMPSVLGPDAVYFDSESVESITAALRLLMADPALRTRISQSAFARSRSYSWERCARDTFAFLKRVEGTGCVPSAAGSHQHA